MIEGFRVQNYRTLRDVTLGRLWNTPKRPALTPLAVVIGKNGVGKSTLFDAFGFVADALGVGVEEACERNSRGGFVRLCSGGPDANIRFEIYYREAPGSRPLTYELEIGLDASQRPTVAAERLRQRRKDQKHGWPFSFLSLQHGEGTAWAGAENPPTEDETAEDPAKMPIKLTDPRELGLSTLGGLADHPRIAKFRDFVKGWYLSYFAPDAAREVPLSGAQKHLNLHGDNLGNVVQFMEREHPGAFQGILDRIAAKIPGIQHISTFRSPEDGRLFLRFNERGFVDPFLAQQMSDGTLKIFAYLLLLEDPDPPPFIGIEEPENGLYHKLLASLGQEFRNHANNPKRASQVFVTTHQPYLVDALTPEEVWILDKGQDGFSTIKQAAAIPHVQALVNEELPLGGLWFSDYFDRA